MTKTVGDYIALLRPNQQDYIVFAVKQYTDRPDFHRGLLPFLPAEEAARCLQMHLEHIKMAANSSDPDVKNKSIIGEKFLKQMISVFRSALIYRASEDEESEVLRLDSRKLKKRYGYRYGHKFHITLAELGVTSKVPLKGLIQLQMISRNQWKITGHTEYVSAVGSWLMDEFGYYGR